MLSKNSNLANAGPRRGTLWLGVFAVGWLQVSVAAHQFDHVAQQLGEPCQVCIQIDRADDVAVDQSTATTTVPVSGVLLRQVPASIADRTLSLGFDSRAPPRL